MPLSSSSPSSLRCGGGEGWEEEVAEGEGERREEEGEGEEAVLGVEVVGEKGQRMLLPFNNGCPSES